MELHVQLILMRDQFLDQLRERRNGLVHSEKYRRIIIEHRELVIGSGVVGAEGIAGRQQPTTWPENPQHLVHSGRNIAHMVEGGLAADDVEGLALEGKDVRQPPDPASLGHDRSSPVGPAWGCTREP